MAVSTAPHTHKWVAGRSLEVYPPIEVAVCSVCGMKRHTTSSGKVTYYPKASATAGRVRSGSTGNTSSR